jgi:hypothetical protein
MTAGIEALQRELMAAGWFEKGRTLFAPHETMWLETESWPRGVPGFLEDVRSRVARLERWVRESGDLEPGVLEDARSALAAAERVLLSPGGS